MSAHLRVIKKNTSNRRTSPSTNLQRSEDESLASAVLNDKAPLNAQSITALQRTQGNQFVQRLLREQNQPVVPIRHIQSGTVSRKKIQRNIFHTMAKPLSKMLSLGSGKSRRGGIEDKDAVKNDNLSSFRDVQDVSIQNQQFTLRGRYYLGKPPNLIHSNVKYAGYTILFLGGSGGSAEQYSLPVAKEYCAQGANVLAVNYRGFGASTKLDNKGRDKRVSKDDITDAGLYSDARAIFDWLQGQGVADSNIIIHGYSLGGAMASNLVADLAEEGIRVGGLVMHSPIDSVRSQAKGSAPTKGMGAFAANAGGLSLDSIANLDRLSKVPGYQNLAIHFMTGRGQNAQGQEDQLSLDQTDMENKSINMGLTNVTGTQAANSGHFDLSDHMSAAMAGGSNYPDPRRSLDRLFPQAPVQQGNQAQQPAQNQPATQQPTNDTQYLASFGLSNEDAAELLDILNELDQQGESIETNESEGQEEAVID